MAVTTLAVFGVPQTGQAPIPAKEEADPEAEATMIHVHDLRRPGLRRFI